MTSRTAPSLDGAEAWLLRADEHLYDLEAIILPLLKAERDAMIATLGDPDPDPAILGSLNLSKASVAIPDRVSILLGEGVQALRRSLDYLIYELAWLDSGRQQNGTQFPLEDSDLRFWRRLHRVKGGPAAFLYGLKGEHAAVIERYQPYFGAHWPKVLRTISNPDKHRHLTITKSGRSVTLTAQQATKGQAVSGDGIMASLSSCLVATICR